MSCCLGGGEIASWRRSNCTGLILSLTCIRVRGRSAKYCGLTGGLTSKWNAKNCGAPSVRNGSPEKATPVSIFSAACEHVELSCATRANHSDTRTIGVHALWEGLMTSHLLIFRPLYVRIVQLSRGTRAAGYLTMSLNYVRFCWWAGSIVAAVYFLYRGKSGVRPFSMQVLFFQR